MNLSDLNKFVKKEKILAALRESLCALTNLEQQVKKSLKFITFLYTRLVDIRTSEEELEYLKKINNVHCSQCNKNVDVRDIGKNGAYTNDNEVLCFECFLKYLNS